MSGRSLGSSQCNREMKTLPFPLRCEQDPHKTVQKPRAAVIQSSCPIRKKFQDQEPTMDHKSGCVLESGFGEEPEARVL
jgi:hypothetical protein